MDMKLEPFLFYFVKDQIQNWVPTYIYVWNYSQNKCWGGGLKLGVNWRLINN
jgi:hypothetical protein